jgi:uncharacterized protein YndB with AHSA1/START domain
MTAGKPKFVYVTYIASTAEKVFEALTDASISKQFWFGFHVESDWKAGSPFALKRGDTIMDSGVVLLCEPPHRLSYTWHPEYQSHRHERPSRVLFEIEQLPGQVKLTVTHDDFDDGSRVFESISGGWPLVLSSLKSMLETGTALAATFSEDDMKKLEATCAT